MPKPNPENEVAKRNYLRWLENAQGRDEDTVDQVATALARFEAHTGRKAFSSFSPERARAINGKSAAVLSPAIDVKQVRTTKISQDWLYP